MQAKYAGLLPLVGLGLGSIGLSRLLSKRAPDLKRKDMIINADADTGELYNTMHGDDGWRSILNQWGPRDTIYHPSDEWTWNRSAWEDLSQKEKDFIHQSGKPVHKWVSESALPTAPVKIGDKLYSPDAMIGKGSKFFKDLGLNDVDAGEAVRGRFGADQLKWVRKKQGFGMIDPKDSP